MATRYYAAILEPAKKGGYGVYFPDLPGCTSGGDTLEDAARNAEEALAFHLEGMAEAGEPIAEPTSARKPPRGCVLMLVPVEPPGRLERINVTLDKSLLAVLDRHAALLGKTRSGYLAHLILVDLAHRLENWPSRLGRVLTDELRREPRASSHLAVGKRRGVRGPPSLAMSYADLLGDARVGKRASPRRKRRSKP